MILVIDNYDSFTYNIVQLLAALGAEVEVRRNDEVTATDALAMRPAGIVISPGPGTPKDAGVSGEVVRAAEEAGVPVLGICLGHQVIAALHGASVVRALRPVHGKTDEIHHDGRGVFAGVPSPMTATRYHSLVVDAATVTGELTVTARTADGMVMGIEVVGKPVFGVQFHPESVLTPEGAGIIANFLKVCGEIPGEAPGSAAPQAVSAAGGAVRSAEQAAAVTSVPGAIARVSTGGSLAEEEARAVMGAIMDGEATPAQIAALVVGMRMKGETVDEIVGFAQAMRERATPVRPAIPGVLDTCGTGGDGLHTFNISTATAFVVAGAGVPVAKHGNRAVSSSAGSADVLEALGVNLGLDSRSMARCIEECGVGFLFAPTLHASMRHAAGPRREIGIRTVFNILGPLTNPAGAARQLLGVYDPRLAPVLAEVAGRLGAERVLVVHGHPGMDEVSASGPTLVAEFDASSGGVRTYEIEPEQVGIARSTLADVVGGDAQENAAMLRRVLEGEHGPRRDIVLLNAAAALLAAGAGTDLADGVERARASIDSGRAAEALERLIAVSNRLAEEAIA
ncbi:anthranilate phosphoribosyltransferase [Coriobacteriia bacterium Es71-Z0120]|uniref:anthranilate phosphoribosyltransferase n=1 Tax=Parvivirga hydrogeniphila TaxID=2939460 RepID=UPI002260F3A9|nr:anthranilate phosphoribosyltransferase [Parvivirga hydrogeniphila]MCL4078825.1 anthranilate phosphoribosyltransferase [Parvivirga hydrogeniphila]